MHSGATVNVGRQISDEQSKSLNKSDEFSELDSEVSF